MIAEERGCDKRTIDTDRPILKEIFRAIAHAAG